MTARTAGARSGRWRAGAASLALVTAVLAGCTGAPTGPDEPAPTGPTGQGTSDLTDGAQEPAADPRPLTSEEAQGLATMRFQNYAAGVRAVSFTVTDAGRTYAVTGWADFVAHLGYATVHEDSTGTTGLLAWTPAAVATYSPDAGTAGSSASAGSPAAAGPPPLPPPGLDAGGEAWVSSELVPDQSRLHAMLATVLALGNDRPDNPVLLQQSDARWLREDSLEGTQVQVVAAPTSDDLAAQDPDADGSASTVRYWVDDDWRAVRLEARLGGTGEWVAVDLAEADDVEFADAFTASAQAPGTATGTGSP